MNNKICIDCNIDKHLSEFYKDKYRKDGLNPYCKKCVKIHQNERHEKYPWKRLFIDIKGRCNKLSNTAYKYYGGRGIKSLITEDELKFLWFRDKAYLMKKPSIDRKNSKKDYTIDNCEFIEFAENTAKDKRKPIFQFDLNGNFIRKWKSQAEVSIKLGISQGNISQCASGSTRFSNVGGFKWRYTNGY